LPIRKHRSATEISVHGQISGQNSDNMISSLFINRTLYAFSHIRTVIIPQPISIAQCVCVCVCVCVHFRWRCPIWKQMINYRLLHALFHTRTVITPRNRYRSDGFSPRIDIGRGMITVLLWKKAFINLFIRTSSSEMFIVSKIIIYIFDPCLN
jgi:hypothetical protein